MAHTYPTPATRSGEAESGLVFYTNVPDSRSKLVEFGIVNLFTHASGRVVKFQECLRVPQDSPSRPCCVCIRTKHEVKKCKGSSNAWQWFCYCTQASLHAPVARPQKFV